MAAYDWLRQPPGTEHYMLCPWAEALDRTKQVRAYAHQYDGKVKLTSLNVQDPKTGESFKLIHCVVVKPCREVKDIGRPNKRKRNTEED